MTFVYILNYTGGGRRGSRIPSSSGGNSRRGSTDMGEPTTVNSTFSSDSFTYWFQVCVEPAVSLHSSEIRVLCFVKLSS